MSNLTQFLGGGPTTSIVNYYSSGSVQSGRAINAGFNDTGAKAVLTDNTGDAGTLNTILSATGAGEVPLLLVYATDTTPRTVRAKVTVDGVTVFDATSSAITTAGYGLVVCGLYSSLVGFNRAPVPIRYSVSLLVEVASSVASETGKIGIGYILHGR